MSAQGREDRSVQPNRERKSYGKETTLDADIDDTHQMMDILESLAKRVLEGLRREDRQGLTLTLKVKYHDFIRSPVVSLFQSQFAIST